MLTKQTFETALRRRLLSTYGWAADPARLDRFMEGVYITLRGGRPRAMLGPSFIAVWRELGGTGTPTYKALHALPDAPPAAPPAT